MITCEQLSRIRTSCHLLGKCLCDLCDCLCAFQLLICKLGSCLALLFIRLLLGCACSRSLRFLFSPPALPAVVLLGGGILASTLDHGLASACGVWGNVQGLVSACGVMVIFCSTNDDEKLRALESALWLVGKAVGFLLGLVMHLQFGSVKGFEQALCL